jgi:hypothetical protein
MVVILVNDRNSRVTRAVDLAQAIGRQRSAGTAT